VTSPNISAGIGDAFTDGQLIDTITPRDKTTRAQTANPITERAEPVWDPIRYPHSWRAVWHYSHKRALHDRRTLTAQENKARAVVAGEKTARNPRFVTTSKGTAVLNEEALTRAKQLVGLKGYVTNIPITAMPGQEVIDAYHDLWNIEQSFRMSKHWSARRFVDSGEKPEFIRTCEVKSVLCRLRNLVKSLKNKSSRRFLRGLGR